MGKVAVMGAGSWGSAFSTICADADEDVVIWAREPAVAKAINSDHRNPDYLGEIDLHPRVRATTDPHEALSDAEIIVLAIPSHALRPCLEDWRDIVPRSGIFVSLIKGIELSSNQRASQIVRSTLDVPLGHVVVVSGPNLAKECARRLPGATVAAGPETTIVERGQAMSHTPYFRV